jgi:hypothetical protein
MTTPTSMFTTTMPEKADPRTEAYITGRFG